MKDTTKIKARNVGKVAKAIVEDPNITHRELQKKAGIASNTVQKAKDELKQNGSKDPIIAFIIKSSKKNLENISKANLAMTKAVINEYLDYDEETDEYILKDKTKLPELTLYMNKITPISKDDLARITMLGGTATDDNGGLKDTSITITIV